MYPRQKIGLNLGVVATVICGGHFPLAIGYVGNDALLSLGRDNPLVNVAGVLIGAVALFLASFGGNDGFFPSRDPFDRIPATTRVR